MIHLHRKYLFNKTNCIILLCLFIAVFFFILLFLNPLESMREHWLNRSIEKQEMEHNFYLIFSPLLVILYCFLFGNFFTRKKDNYNILLDAMGDKQSLYFFTKVLSIVETCVLFSLLVYFLYQFLFCLLPYGSFEKEGFQKLLYLNGEGFVYGLFSLGISCLFQNGISFLIPYLLSLMMEIIKEDFQKKTFYAILALFFPTLPQSLSVAYWIGLVGVALGYYLFAYVFYLEFSRKKK